MTKTSMVQLHERRILVAEDEYMIADEITTTLDRAGAVVVGPVSNVGDALRIIASEARLDAALLDVYLLGELIWPVVDALLEQGVPVVLSTGYDANFIPPKYAVLPCCEKPTTGRDVVGAVGSAMGLL